MNKRVIAALTTPLLALGMALAVESLAAAPSKYEPVELAQSGTVVGVVTFSGAQPKPQLLEVTTSEDVCHKGPIHSEELVVAEGGAIKWAVGSLRKIPKGKPFPKEDESNPVTLDQVGCRFVPHVVVVPAGRTLRVLNSDGILHNVHIKGRRNKPVNKSMPAREKQRDMKFKRPERMKVVCDVHPWMGGWIVVTEHPYYAVSGDDGTFRLDQVPVGKHTLEVWQEKLGSKTKEISVKAGEETRVEFVFPPSE